ncbi:EF-hand domain [Trypanosoma melophagium]|uniref:EF-hand domain n=1 Tax=Trypanosoma melophagium TaxID=715481 RepID=UPI00351A8DCC|nr:EF-hand domain [Trypanosoma melophagium]
MNSSTKKPRASLRSNHGNSQRRPTVTQLEESKKDGITLKRADVEAAFAFFDVQNKKELKPRDLKMRLSAFYPDMTNKEFKFLLDETTNGSFTVESLWNIVENFHGLHTSAAESLRFDPVKEAFHIYDPHGQGVVDVDVLAGIMKRIGLGELSHEEMELLIQTADFDKDGKINLEDFRNLLRIGR